MALVSAFLRHWLSRRRPDVQASPGRGVGMDIFEPATLADSHLVMNALNQLAAGMHARGGDEDPRLFALADYLRLVLRFGTSELIAVQDEFLLLQSYIQLVARNRLIEIAFEFSPGLDTDTLADLLVQRHLSCDLVGALLRALPGERARQCQLRIGFEGAAADHAYVLRASLRHPAGDDLQRRLQAEFNDLITRFDPARSVPQSSFIHADNQFMWTVSVAAAASGE